MERADCSSDVRVRPRKLLDRTENQWVTVKSISKSSFFAQVSQFFVVTLSMSKYSTVSTGVDLWAVVTFIN